MSNPDMYYTSIPADNNSDEFSRGKSMDKIERTNPKTKEKRPNITLKVIFVALLCVAMLFLGYILAESMSGLI